MDLCKMTVPFPYLVAYCTTGRKLILSSLNHLQQVLALQVDFFEIVIALGEWLGGRKKYLTNRCE